MAVCEIWDVRGRLDHPIDYIKNPEKTRNSGYTEDSFQAMEDVMKYAVNSDKTEQQFYISGVNCDPATARNEMLITKMQWSDESKIVCYHGFQSFKAGEVTAELAHKIGVALAEDMWGDRFQVVVATHLNTEHFHNHFVINSVSYIDGKHYHDNKKNLYLFRRKSDELCRKYRLSVIENPSGRKKPYGLYTAEKMGLPTRDVIARAAIDEAIAKSYTLQDFARCMRDAGYSVNVSAGRKYWTIKGEGWERGKRLYRLGDDYTNESIIKRIRENSYIVTFKKFAPKDREARRFKVGRRPTKKVGGLRGLYLHYCYLLGILPKGKKTDYKRVHRLLRDELLKLDRITNETRLLCRKRIDTAEQLFAYREQLLQEKEELLLKRKPLYARAKKAEGAEKERIQRNISEITGRLKTIRKDVRLCDSVMARSRSIGDKLSEIRKEDLEEKEVKRCTQEEMQPSRW